MRYLGRVCACVCVFEYVFPIIGQHGQMLHLNTPVVGEFVVHIQSGSLELVLLY